MENVKNLKSHDKGNTFRVIWDTLTNHLKYAVYPQSIDAQGLVPQHREHIFLVGFRKKRHFEFLEFPRQWQKHETILDVEIRRSSVHSGDFGNVQVSQVTES